MKLTSVLRSSSGWPEFVRVAGTGLSALLATVVWLARAADANQATNEIVLPKSVFVRDDPRGKDPFYPNRPRLGLTAPITNAVSTASAPNLKDLQLKGISGPPERRIAAINNLTFEKGEEGEVRVPNGKLRIRVLEIREKSVVVSVEGVAEPKELLLNQQVLPLSE